MAEITDCLSANAVILEVVRRIDLLVALERVLSDVHDLDIAPFLF